MSNTTTQIQHTIHTKNTLLCYPRAISSQPGDTVHGYAPHKSTTSGRFRFLHQNLITNAMALPLYRLLNRHLRTQFPKIFSVFHNYHSNSMWWCKTSCLRPSKIRQLLLFLMLALPVGEYTAARFSFILDILCAVQCFVLSLNIKLLLNFGGYIVVAGGQRWERSC